MKAKHAAEIRAGILFARANMPRRQAVVRVLNSRYFSKLAVYAVNEYVRRKTSMERFMS